MVEILSTYECYSHTIDQFNIKGERGPMSNEHWLAISHDLAVFNFVFKLHVGLVLKIFCE